MAFPFNDSHFSYSAKSARSSERCTAFCQCLYRRSASSTDTAGLNSVVL